MAEINCPMCGNPNREGAETCVHCGARLTPVSGGEAASDWLSEIRGQAEGKPGGSRPEGSSPFSQPENAETSEPDSDDLAAGEVPDWLRRIRKKRAAEQDQPEDDFGDEAEDEAPEPAVAAFEATDEPEDPRAGFDLGRGAEPEDPRAGFDLGRDAAPEDPRAGFDLGRGAEPEDPRAGFDLGDDGEPEDPLADFEFEGDADQAEGAGTEGMPSWLKRAGESRAADQPASAGRPRGERAGKDQAPPPAEPEQALPHVSPLIGDQSADLDADELGLPDWLGEIEPLEDAPERPAPEPGPGLERATLPNWLEAMRPVDTFRSVVKIDAEDDQAIESVGPLAGLRGVLLAEPVVAMPRTSTTGAMQLEVSERQYAQAELLHRMISEEEGSRAAAPKRRIPLSFFRWGIAAVTLIAAALPILTGSPGFALPALEPKELGPLFDLVGRLPIDRPTLFVYDYDPGNAGELDAVSGALLDQVMSRGLPVASVSTRPTGSPLAERAMQRYATRHGYVAGSDLIHLGYLSGGPAAVQLFSLNPRGAILKGFALPESMVEAGQSAWDSPVLANVRALSDFGMVAVITAGSEIARVWVEQAEPLMGDTPLLMVLSAGAEPLVRPYYEASRPQINAILTGLPAAVAYEQRNGRFGPALDHWNSFGAGMLAAELVLIAGAGYGLVRWVLARRAG